MSAIVLDKKFFDNNKKFELNVINENGKILSLKNQIHLFHILKSKHDFNIKEERRWAVQNGLFEKFWYDYVHPEFDQMNARGMSILNVLNEIVRHQQNYGLNIISCIYDKKCIYNVMNSLIINLKDTTKKENVIKSCKKYIKNLQNNIMFYRKNLNPKEEEKIENTNMQIAYNNIKHLPNFNETFLKNNEKNLRPNNNNEESEEYEL